MTIDPRTPVVVGVGQLNQDCPASEARTPVELFGEAVRLASADAGHGLANRIDTIAAVGIVSWPYGDPAAVVARELGLTTARTALSTTGGNSPQLLINEMAERIRTNRADIIVVGGAESMHARWSARKEPKVELVWPSYEDPECADTFGVDTAGTNAWEMAHQMFAPTMVYPLFETALRAAAGHSITEHQQFVGDLWSEFATVAANNPNAWRATPLSSSDIATPSRANRMVVFPYTKRMCANIDVDQGAAVMLTSYDTARAAGVPAEQLVFLHAGADAHDHWWVSERPSLADSVAIGVNVRAVLQASGVALDDVARFDLYSCFPSAVQLAMKSIGLRGSSGGDSRPLTVTGGLCFAGGPVNNYPTHGVAQMVNALRADPGSYGLTTALGWYATKHSAALWSTTPPTNGYRRIDPAKTQAEVDAIPIVEQANAYTGTITIEATSVAIDRDTNPTVAIIAGRTPDGKRAIANSTDADAMRSMCETPWEGRSVSISTRGETNALDN